MTSRSRHGDDLLIGALASGVSVEVAAKMAGISIRTAYRRLSDPAFARRLTEARDELMRQTLAELIDSASEAVATLRGLLKSPDDRVKLNAAKSTLDQLLRLRETLTLNERLVALERAMRARDNG